MNNRDIIRRLETEHDLSREEAVFLLNTLGDEDEKLLADAARKTALRQFGNKIFIRGLIEISSYCKNDCCYCGIRRSNRHAVRYRLSEEQILSCCEQGYALGFRTFVLQGGEDGYFTDDRVCAIVRAIKARYPDCAVTLSLGERGEQSLRRLYEAGADRYLLRHETADRAHYEKLHPPQMNFDNRMENLRLLKSIGYQTGAGFMVGSPYQTTENLADDLLFIKAFQPQMCGIGPFVPHKDTDYRDYPHGSLRTALILLSVIRLMNPSILLPATTALGTIDKNGRELGILHGANVVMPNLSPQEHRADYSLYDNKISTGEEAAESVALLAKKLEAIGYEIAVCRGDYQDKTN